MKLWYAFQIACGAVLAGLMILVAWPLPKDSFDFFGCLSLICGGFIMVLSGIFNLSQGGNHEN